MVIRHRQRTHGSDSAPPTQDTTNPEAKQQQPVTQPIPRDHSLLIPHDILQLQRSIGNQAVQRLLSGSPATVQASRGAKNRAKKLKDYKAAVSKLAKLKGEERSQFKAELMKKILLDQMNARIKGDKPSKQGKQNEYEEYHDELQAILDKIDSLRSIDPQTLSSEQWTPTDWNVTQETWQGIDQKEDESDLEHVYRQLRNDAVIMFQTMFADPTSKGIELNEEEAEDHRQRQEFLKRLFLAQAIGGVGYSTEDNPTHDQLQYDLNLPMGALLSHGQRHLFEMGEGSDSDEFYNFLMTGDTEDKGDIAKKRSFASHQTEKTKGGQVKEKKVSLNQFGGGHTGVDLPLGGVGNVDVSGNLIGPSGQALDPDTHESLTNAKGKEKQHGHAYINKHDWAIMVGIEGNRPGTENMFAVPHNMKSGMEDQTTKRSSTGGQKMEKLLGAEHAPAEYGGKQTLVTGANFAEMQKFYDILNEMPLEDQKAFFKQLLTSNPANAKALIVRVIEEYGDDDSMSIIGAQGDNDSQNLVNDDELSTIAVQGDDDYQSLLDEDD